METMIVLLPGLLCDASLFTEQVAALAQLGPVKVCDLTRSGTIAGLADDVLEEIPPGRFVMVGLSMGGYVAFEIMRKTPGRVAALVLIDTTARPDTQEATALREALIRQAETDFPGVTEQLLPRLSHPDLLDQPEVRGVIQSMATSLGKEVFIRQQRAIIERPDSRPTLPEISCPTLVICGRDDQITPPEVCEEIAAAIGQAEFRIIEQCGHLSTLDQPAQLSDLLLEWISKTTGTAIERPDAAGA